MKRRQQEGYTLLEVLMVVLLMAALTPTVSKVFISITRLHTAQSNALDRVLLFDNLEHDFRAAATQALGIVSEAGPFKTDDRTVIFRTPAGFTVFTTDAQKHPKRINLRAADGGWRERINTYSIPHWRFRFSAEPGGRGASFTARPMQAENRQGVPTPPVQVLAALRSFDAREDTP